MEKNETPNARREFLVGSASLIGGLAVAFYIPKSMKMAAALAAEEAPKKAAAAVYPPNAFIHIAPDNTITMVINKLEMGQGVNTSLAQLIAEELECDWKSIRSVSAPVDAVYNNTLFPMQMTGGSTALISSWDQHRKIGAGMREMLKTAAAHKWNVPVSEVKAENGFITHPSKGKLSYGELADEAGKLPLPENPPLKESKDFKIIGKSIHRVDAPDKSSGKAIYGMDVRIPGMMYAVVTRPPIAGAKMVSMNEKAARAIPGVLDVVKFSDRVAVLGKNTYAAKTGRDALDVKWENTANGKASTEAMMADFRKQAASKGIVADNRGSVDTEMPKAKKKISAEYEFPFLSHASMEPLNCTVQYDGKTAELWAGHQMPTNDRAAAAQIFGLPPEKVNLNTVYAGGSFGRRANKNSDFVVEACELAKIVKKPLKVVWTREDDMRGGYYRPMNFHQVTLGLDEHNHLLAWDHHIVGQSVIANSVFEKFMVKDGLEATVTEGIAGTPYDLTNFRCEQTRAVTPMTTLWWRSVGSTHTAYVMETMIDELAENMKKDPLELRKTMLKKSPRHIAVLELLQKQTHWGKKHPPAGRAWGLAIHESFNTVVGHVAEVSIKDGIPKVHKVWSAVHCGKVVNPDGAKTQVEGAIVFGLSAAFTQQIEVKDGEVVQSNFHDYTVMRIQDMPEVHVEFVQTEDHPTGLGEPGLPPIAPAVANALYKLTKKRLRVLPFTKELQA